MCNSLRVVAGLLTVGLSVSIAGAACLTLVQDQPPCGTYTELGALDCCGNEYPQYIVMPTQVWRCETAPPGVSGSTNCDNQGATVFPQICEYECNGCGFRLIDCDDFGPGCKSGKYTGSNCTGVAN